MPNQEPQPYSEDQAYEAIRRYGEVAFDLMKGRLLCEQTLEITPVEEADGQTATVTYLRPELASVSLPAAHSEAA